MGFNRRKTEDQRRDAAEKEAASRRATDAQVLEDAERLIAAWNERQAKRMPMLFSPTIGAAIAAGYWFLWVGCPACRTTNAIDLRTLDGHHDAAITSLIPALSCPGRMHRLPSWCDYREQASATKCAKNIVVACLANDCPCRPVRHQLLPLMSRSISLSRKKTKRGLTCLTGRSLPALSVRTTVLTLTCNLSATSRRVRSRST
jgi:hypothetical protein